MVLLLVLFSSAACTFIYCKLLSNAIIALSPYQVLKNAGNTNHFLDKNFKVSIIIPAYNEEKNIQDCLVSVLESTKLSVQNLEVLVVDDESIDSTVKIVKNLQQSTKDLRLKLILGEPRPTTQVWIGKNWACYQGFKQASGSFLLFLDADVRLKTKAIESVLNIVMFENIDFLNCIPAVACTSVIEWLVQPLMFINLVVSLNHRAAKNPNTQTAYAAGPFMLFQRAAYNEIGGHYAVGSEVAEDVALARLVKKHKKLKSKYMLGSKLATLRMYDSFAPLWEGWTKVLYAGSQHSIILMCLLAIVMLNIYFVPWLGLLIILCDALVTDWNSLEILALCVAIIGITIQYQMRWEFSRALDASPKYWWLHWIGGLLIAVMAIVSVIKTEIGWGWTWKGRQLAYIKQKKNSL